MSIPNYSVTINQLAEEKQLNVDALKPPLVEHSLEQALETLKKTLDELPASAASKLVQPRPSGFDPEEQ